MIRQNYLPTVQLSSVQKKETKENQYQMHRGPLSSATHTKTKQQQQQQEKHTNRTIKRNKNMKRQVEVKQDGKKQQN